jgi:hypothetical protein
MSSIVAPPHSVLNLLDNFFGGVWGSASVEGISDAELFNLAEAIDDHYDRVRVPPAQEGVIRNYSGGASVMQPKVLVPGAAVPMPTLPSGSFIPFIPSALLYVEELAINCPLDSWICRHRGNFRVPLPYRAENGISISFSQPAAINDDGFWKSPVDLNRRRISEALGMLADLDRGIRDGWLILVPHLRHWKRHEHAIWTQVRRDVMDLEFMDVMKTPWSRPPAVSDFVRGHGTFPSGGYIPQDHNRALSEGPSLYFNATLAIASSTHARLLPAADSEYGMLAYKINRAKMLNRQLRDGLLIHAMESVLAPAVESEKIDEVMAIRADSHSFADWRHGLSEAVSGKYIPSNVDIEESQQLVAEQLQELVEGIRREGREASSLGARLSRARLEGIDIGFAAALCLAPGDLVVKVLSGLALLLKAAVQVASSPLDGRSSVLLRLDKAHVTE